MSVRARVASLGARVRRRLRGAFREAATYRADARRLGSRLLLDAVVVLALLAVIAAVVLGAGYAIVFAVNSTGVLGVVLGWVAAFGMAVAVPVVAMRVGSALYGRLDT